MYLLRNNNSVVTYISYKKIIVLLRVCHLQNNNSIIQIIVQAVYYIDRCIEISPACRKFRIQKAECLALLRRYQESQEIVK